MCSSSCSSSSPVDQDEDDEDDDGDGMDDTICASRAYSLPVYVSFGNAYTLWAIKTCHFSVFDYNSGVSWSIFMLSVPVETGRNTLQFIYLTARWRHNCVILHVTKFCFIQLLLKIKYVWSLKIDLKNVYHKPVGMWKFFLQKTDKRISCQEFEKTNIRRLSAKVVNNRFYRTHCNDWLQNMLFLMLLVLPGSVETELWWSGKFC